MGLFSTLAFSRMGGKALTATAVAYAAAFALAGHHLWHRRGLRLPGGLLIAVAVSMAPLAVYGLQDAYGLWSHGSPGAYRDFYVWIKGSWVFMEIAAIVAAVIALRFYPFPFIVLIIAFSLWFMSMDLTPWVFGKAEFTWEERRAVSLWFGLAVLVVAWLVDRRQRGGDFAFWLHLFGMLTFWGALSLSDSASELGKFLYCHAQRRPAARRGLHGAASLRGVRHPRHCVLSRVPRRQGVRGLAPVPIRPVADRRRRHRHSGSSTIASRPRSRPGWRRACRRR